MDLLFKAIAFAESARKWMLGKKTYLVCASAIITALIAWASGTIDNTALVKYIFEAITAATLRAGISKSGLEIK